MNASQINNLKLIMPLEVLWENLSFVYHRLGLCIRHYKQCTNKPLIGEKRSLANHINANFVLKTPFRGKLLHADFNVLNNCKISNCQIPNYAPRFHLIILFQLLFTYLLAMLAQNTF